jgi:hypothetical protein
MNAVTAAVPRVPFTGNDSLSLSVRRSDFSGLMGCAVEMRTAGYQVDPFGLATLLQETGEAQVRDAFGKRVAIRLRDPEVRARPLSVTQFRLAL